MGTHCYVVTPDRGLIENYTDKNGQCGVDRLTGLQMSPVTPSILLCIRAMQRGIKPHRLAISAVNTEEMFDGGDGHSLYWFHQASATGIDFYDGPGFDQSTLTPLEPITHENAEKIQRYIKQQQDAERTAQEPVAGVIDNRQTISLDAVSMGPEINIWKVGSPHAGDLPSDTLPFDLRRLAAEKKLEINVKAFYAQGFAEKYFEALEKGKPPELLVINNYGILEGITTELGKFDGIATTKEVEDTLVFTEGSFESLTDSRRGGWEILISNSPNYGAAKELAFRKQECNNNWIGTLHDMPAELIARFKGLSTEAVNAYFVGDGQKLTELSGGFLPLEESPIRPADFRLRARTVDVCGAWGNEQLLFITLLTSFEGIKEIGYKSLLLIIDGSRSPGRLMTITEQSGLIQELMALVPKLPSQEARNIVKEPALINPPDHVKTSRESKPNLEWSNEYGTILYLVESQYDDPGSGRTASWSLGYFKPVLPYRSSLITSMPMFFGVGFQPHRWRVWAIFDGGKTAISDWRVVDFTD